MKKADDILRAGLDTLVQRGVDRDKPAGERSMPAIVRVFQALTGIRLSERDGWLFMLCLKLVRMQSGKTDADHYLDAANYVALMGEAALATGKESLPVDAKVPPMTEHENALEMKGFEQHLQKAAEHRELQNLLRQRNKHLAASTYSGPSDWARQATDRICTACDGTGNCAIDRSATYTLCRACGGTGMRGHVNGTPHIRIDLNPGSSGDTPFGPYTLDIDGNLSGPAGTHNVAQLPDGVCPVCAGDGYENRKLGTLCRTCTGTGAL